MYQHLKHDPALRAANTILAVYRQQAEAEKLIEASPLRYEVSSMGLKQVTREPDQDEGSIQADASRPASGPRELHMRVESSATNYQAQLKRQHYYGSFEPERNTVMFADLVDRVPVPGIADCQIEKGELPLRIRQKRMEQEERERRGPWRENLAEMWGRGQEEAGRARLG